MDANRVLNASLNGAASAAAIYLLGRAGGYRFPRAAAALVGTAVGVGSYRALVGVDFDAIAERAEKAADEAVDEGAEMAEREAEAATEIEVETPDDAPAETPAAPRRRTEVLASAVEHAMGFRTDEDAESSA
jgi:hypothetical protein